MAGARVVATGEIEPVRFPKDRRPAIFLGAPEAITDGEGWFLLERVGPGAQVISVIGGDDIAGWTQLSVPVEGEVVVRSRQIRGHIDGRVVDDRDRPIDVALVMGGGNTTHTFADGSFTLENFRGDLVEIRFEHPDFRPETLAAVVDGTHDLLVRMENRLPQVFFRIRDRDTLEPVETVAIVLTFAGGGGVLSASPFHLGKEGLFAVRIPDGVVSASVRHAGRARPTETVDLAAARDGDVIEVLLSRAERPSSLLLQPVDTALPPLLPRPLGRQHEAPLEFETLLGDPVERTVPIGRSRHVSRVPAGMSRHRSILSHSPPA